VLLKSLLSVVFRIISSRVPDRTHEIAGPLHFVISDAFSAIIIGNSAFPLSAEQTLPPLSAAAADDDSVILKQNIITN
jgi:hypothetical protein